MSYDPNYVRHKARANLFFALGLLRYGGATRHPLLRDLDADQRPFIAKRLCFMAKHGFVYQRVPKAANSTIALTLFRHIPEFEAIRVDRHGNRAKQVLRGLPSPAEFAQSYSFAFVRHPVARVLSAWRDKGHKALYRDRYGLHGADGPGSQISFPDFLARLEDGLLERDLHWRPQAGILLGRGQGFSRIARVERIGTDLPEIIEAIFGTCKGVFTVEADRTGAAKHVGEFVGPAERARIEALYAEDFERFYPDG